jgi:hypothetical protein
VLGLFGIIRDPVTTTEGFFQFLKDDYRTLEFSCLKNRGGCFVELCDYYSGAQQGGIRVLEGRSGAGWVRFAAEVRRFFLGKNSAATVAGREKHCATNVAGGEQKIRIQLRNVRKSNFRDFRRQQDTRDYFTQRHYSFVSFTNLISEILGASGILGRISRSDIIRKHLR